MNWGKRTVSDMLTVERYTVNDIIVNYIKDQFYVNRRYQRKLVWGLDEKQLLIDSMIKKIPLPAILLVKFDIPTEGRYDILEIVDGMQRLNAIISFIMGEFGIGYGDKICYFDPHANNETFQLLMDNDKMLKVNTSLLPKDLCVEFCRYNLPAIITGKDDATVDLIFSRINSTGRKISYQDLRQSMATGEFPDLVRRIASDIRMDNTYDDHIRLCEMPQISIGYKRYGYGVDLDTVFWRRHDLINIPNIKESRDEEIIETLLAIVLLGKFQKSKDNLDALYDRNTEINKQIEQKVLDIGKNSLEEKFKKVFDVFDMIFASVNSNFSSYLFTKKNTKNKDECFKMLFLAIYRLISEGYIITDYTCVAECIKNSKPIFDNFTKINTVDYTEIDLATNNLYTLLKTSFSKEIIVSESEITKEIDKRLRYSKIERQMTEFKIGISDFASSSVNINVINDIARTLVAMSNCNNVKEDGLVILGIANSKKAYDDWYAIYKEQTLINNQHYIPGVTKEAEKLYGNTDIYYRKLRKLIEAEPISSKLKDYILQTFEPYDYHGVELIIFKSKNVGEISLYDGIKYVRQSNETVKV